MLEAVDLTTRQEVVPEPVNLHMTVHGEGEAVGSSTTPQTADCGEEVEELMDCQGQVDFTRPAEEEGGSAPKKISLIFSPRSDGSISPRGDGLYPETSISVDVALLGDPEGFYTVY